ncbi:MAG: hypothetical protein GC159_02120 [Phycisphaera sp.]|nr:hypothetical protein [Phycisphaera sp.]
MNTTRLTIRRTTTPLPQVGARLREGIVSSNTAHHAANVRRIRRFHPHPGPLPQGRGSCAPSRRRERGAVLVVVLLIVIVLTGMALTFARSARVEATASANREAAAQARAIAEGAARAVLALGDDIPADAVEVGNGGAYWLIKPNFDDDRTWAFGIVDEAAKININSATADTLLKLPGMDDAIADAIVDWRDTDTEVTGSGAESEYYLLLPEPYNAKDQAFETVEELLLVRDVRPLELYGEDANRNGVLDANEDDASDSAPGDNRDGTLDRGLIDFVTVYSSETASSSDANGEPLVDVNSQQSTQQLLQVLNESLGDDRGAAVLGAIIAGRPHRNLFDMYYKANLTPEEFDQISPRLTASQSQGGGRGQGGGGGNGASQARIGLVDVNSAPREVLAALPGLEESDADALIAARSSLTDTSSASSSSSSTTGATTTTPTSLSWVLTALDREKVIGIGDYITNKSLQRSVDIVAVSAGGRAFERYRMVFDTSGDTPRILHWQRLTHLGWPLDPQILKDLRSGAAVSDLAQTTERKL